MKKMILGLVIGGLLGTAATVSATSGVAAVVYPVKLLLNGKAQQVPAETPILNVNGHAYLPARFLAEASGNKIDYNHEEKSINLSEASSLLIPDSYSVEEAERNGDVVSRGTGTYNLKRLNAFLDSRNNGQRDWVRVTQFTIEGDPILHSFYYDGTALRYEKDSRDGYGVKGMWGGYCQSAALVRSQEPGHLAFELKGCSPGEQTVSLLLPVKDTGLAPKLTLDPTFLAEAAEGRLKGSAFGLGAGRKEMLDAWGEPHKTGSDQTEYSMWNEYAYFYWEPEDTVGAVKVYGEPVRYKVSEVKQALGAPLSEGENDSYANTWTLYYEAGGYQLFFNADGPDGTVRSLLYKKK